MSTRFVLAVLVAASGAAFAAADEIPLLDLESVVGSLVLAPPPALPAVSSPSLRLVWLDPAGVATGMDAMAREEATALFRSMGASATWRRGRAGETARPGEVRVILLDRAAEREPGTPVLGATPGHFEVAPLVWVHVPNVRAALGLPRQGSAFAMDLAVSRALGIALGRVVAHEVVHAFVPWVPHGTGLMSASLSHRQLTAASMAFDPAVAAAVRAALRGEAPPTQPGSRTLATATVAKETE